MKEQLQKAMPDVPLQVLREQREVHENQDLESADEQEQAGKNQDVELNGEDNRSGNDHDTNGAGAAADIEAQYDEENDVTF